MAHRRGISSRILNLSRNCYLKPAQANAMVEAKTAVRVNLHSIRELTWPEVLAARNEAADHVRQLPYRNLLNELPGLRWEPPTSDQYTARLRYPILRQAMEFIEACQAY